MSGFSLSERISIGSVAYSTAPSSTFNTGWFDTSKIATLACWAFYTASGAGVNSSNLTLHGAYDSANPILVDSRGVTADSGYLTYQGSINNWPFPLGRVTWGVAAIRSSYVGSVGIFYSGKG